MENKILSKNLIINFLYAIILFYAFLSIFSAISSVTGQFQMDSMYRDNGAIAFSIVNLVVYAAGFAMFVIATFTSKLSFRILVFGEAIIVVIMTVVIILSHNNDSSILQHNFVQQILYIVALSSIHAFNEYKPKNKNATDNNDKNSSDE